MWIPFFPVTEDIVLNTFNFIVSQWDLVLFDNMFKDFAGHFFVMKMRVRFGNFYILFKAMRERAMSDIMTQSGNLD